MMYDQDPITESDDKCDFCELWAHCTCSFKDIKDQCCFEPADADGELLYREAFGKPYSESGGRGKWG